MADRVDDRAVTTPPLRKDGAPTRTGPAEPARSLRDGFALTAVAVVAFGFAMGYLEAAVVVYLRSAIETGTATSGPGAPAFHELERIEAFRELATLVMIGAVGLLAGRSRLERLAWAAVVFGLWDIVYYAGLRSVIGWPSGLDTWDVLFLVPAPWVGPVWAPIVVSAALVAVGLVAARQLRRTGPIPVRQRDVAVAVAGGLLVIASFLVDSARVTAGDTGPWTGWPLFWLGMGLAFAATVPPLVRPRLVIAGEPPAAPVALSGQ